MTTIQEVRKRKKVGAKGAAQKTKTEEKARDTGSKQETKATEEINPISKSKEWKLLYKTYPLGNTANKISPATDLPAEFSAEERDLGRYRGLCRNCQKREGCELPKPEGGIWRCEAYE
jgi:hypothetical protein